MPRRSNVSDFLTNFNTAMDVMNKVGMAVDQGRVRRSEATELTGFTADQGRQLEDLTKQGYVVDFDPSIQAYRATNDAGDSKTVAMQGITELKGVGRYEGGEKAARGQAMADAIRKYNPERAERLEESAAMRGFNTEKRDRQRKEWGKADSVDAIYKRMGDQLQQSLVNEDGSQRDPTIDDFLGNQYQTAMALQQAGHNKEAMDMLNKVNASLFTKIQLEESERKQAVPQMVAAFQAGDMGTVTQGLRKYGGFQVRSVERADKDGILLTQEDGTQVRVPNTEALAMLQNFGDSRSVFALAQQQMRWGREDAKDERKQAESEQLQSARQGVFLEQNPDATSDQQFLARHGENPFSVGAVDRKSMTSMEKNADALLRYGLAKTQKEAITMARQNAAKSPQERYADVLKTAMSDYRGDVTRARKVADAYMQEVYPDWVSPRDQATQQQQNDRLTQVREQATPEAIKATAEKYGISEDEVRKRLGL